MALILVQVEESKGEDESENRCGDGIEGGDSVSNGGRGSVVTDVYSAVG